MSRELLNISYMEEQLLRLLDDDSNFTSLKQSDSDTFNQCTSANSDFMDICSRNTSG